MSYPRIQGRCPACGGTSLFVGDGGYVTCSRSDCTEPDAATTLLERAPAAPPSPGRRRRDGTGMSGDVEATLAEAAQAILAEIPLDDTGHVTDCGYDDETMGDCDCYGLPGRLAAVLAPVVAEQVGQALEAAAEDWEPGRWWRSIGPDGDLWGESSNEAEIRAMARPGDTIQRLYERNESEWREADRE